MKTKVVGYNRGRPGDQAVKSSVIRCVKFDSPSYEQVWPSTFECWYA